jgi:hypothetical protein
MAIAKGVTTGIAYQTIRSQNGATVPTSGGGLSRQSSPGGINAGAEAAPTVATQSTAKVTPQDSSTSTIGTALDSALSEFGLTPEGQVITGENQFGASDVTATQYTTPTGQPIWYYATAAWNGLGVWVWNNVTGGGQSDSGIQSPVAGLSAAIAANPGLVSTASVGSSPAPSSSAPSQTPSGSDTSMLATLLPWLSSLATGGTGGTTGAGDLPGTSTPISSLGALTPIGTPTSTSSTGSPNLVIIVVVLVLAGVGFFWYLHNKHKKTHQGAPHPAPST